MGSGDTAAASGVARGPPKPFDPDLSSVGRVTADDKQLPAKQFHLKMMFSSQEAEIASVTVYFSR